jgi:RNA polymerase sigma factor for flagellar operon FliA
VSTQDELVASCTRLVERYARQYAKQHGGISVEDLAGEGYIGLVQAAQKFEPGRGTRFTTFAAPRIRGAMIDALRRENPLSRPMADHVAKLKTGQETLRTRLGREPTESELAKELQISDEKAAEIINLRSLRITSLDAQADELAPYLSDERASPEDLAMQAMVSRELFRYLALLRPLDREILVRVYWWHQKHIEVAADLGISASRVSQRRSRALKRLRELIDAAGREAARYLRQAA